MSELRNFGKETGQPMVCPICGNEYTGRGALSRIDNTTIICPDCGTRQSLSGMGVGVEEQNEILEIIHRAVEGKNEQ